MINDEVWSLWERIYAHRGSYMMIVSYHKTTKIGLLPKDLNGINSFALI